MAEKEASCPDADKTDNHFFTNVPCGVEMKRKKVYTI